MSDNLGSFWGGLIWLGGGFGFHLFTTYCGREMEALASAKRVSSMKELSNLADRGIKQTEREIISVVGRVNSEKPLSCKNSRVAAVILEETLEHFFLRKVNGNWVKDSTSYVGTKRQTPWFLEDESGRAYIEGANQAADFDLVVVSDALEDPPPTSQVRMVLDASQGIRMTHVRRVERALPIGTSLTVVGQVARGDNGRVILQRPPRGGPFFVSRKSIDILVSGLGVSSAWCSVFSVACAVVGVCSLVHFFLERRKAARRRSAPPATGQERRRTDDSDPQGVMEIGDSNCVICLDHQYNVAFFPCGHVCCCKDCTNGLSHCPLCRQQIIQKKFVYLH